VSFIGACIEPEHINCLMQCCSRGALQVSNITLIFAGTVVKISIMSPLHAVLLNGHVCFTIQLM